MIDNSSVNLLFKRLKSDANDDRNENDFSWGLSDYFSDLLKDGLLMDEAAIGSAKQGVGQGFGSLSDRQLKALARDLIDNQLFMSECPNEWCENQIAWGDMNIAIWEGQCYHCVNQEEKYERE
ncbi:hypothetical protein MH116_18560 [Bacillus pumilus]|uniref:hypothetical protein n=1 Tax=Bacillus pumilus TaxID=1408 RepID=UPI0022810044|nr:hypothetical protein [Bacillus pumilus]MCY7619848.1 hypothetical protein [Bacillus pumilus]